MEIRAIFHPIAGLLAYDDVPDVGHWEEDCAALKEA